MNQQRLRKVIENLERKGLSQMVVSDPYSIYYLTGRFIDPGERFYALYLNKNGSNKIFINDLFTVPEDLGAEKVRFPDTVEAVPLFCECTESNQKLGVDKNLAARFLLQMMQQNAAKEYINSSECVDEVRSIKDMSEQAKMREASHLNDLGMKKFKELIHPGVTEIEIAQQMDSVYRSLGADGNSFEPLVGFGANAARGHHAPDGTVLKEGDCVLFDVGCKKDGYCADMTRTYFFRSVSDRHRAVYEVVKKANETAESMIKPGIRFCDIDKTARDVIEKAGYGPNFTHRLGHSIGMEVHEPGDVSLSHTDAVRAGMTFSIEPGIYLDGDVGIRVEDLVLVTEDGCEVLNHFSKELQIIK